MLPHIVLGGINMKVENMSEKFPITNGMLLKGMPYVVIHDTGNMGDTKNTEKAKDDE